MLASMASVPVYVLGAGSVGGGALGGCVVDFDDLGGDIADLGLQLLDGTPPETIPVEVRTNGTPMVDWRALKRWGINESRLPKDCIVRFQPPSLWAEHKEFILTGAAIVLAQALTIGGLLVQRRQRHQAQAEILRQRTELAHVTRVSTMGLLSSALAHELNQPLGAILRNTEAAQLFLERQPPDMKELRAILEDIRQDDQRAGKVIDRMRALLQRRDLELAPLNVRELLEEVLVLARADAATRAIALGLELPSPLPQVRGDRVHLQQVLLNLILNGMDAMKACPPDARRLTLRAVRAANGDVQVSVQDRGTGVKAADAEKLFEPFFTTKANGMGMGLAISKTIIEAHDGKLRAENNPDGGATFVFTLPVSRDDV
jgi:signal transduction histidine kinase